jgi:hypothetical protein
MAQGSIGAMSFVGEKGGVLAACFASSSSSVADGQGSRSGQAMTRYEKVLIVNGRSVNWKQTARLRACFV